MRKSHMRHRYDVCIVHMAQAAFYPFFFRQACTLRDRGLRVCVVSWQNSRLTPLPQWEGIDILPIRLFAPQAVGKIFFARWELLCTWYLLHHRARLYQAVDPPCLLPARLAALRHRAACTYFSLEFFLGINQLVGRPFERAVWYLVERFGLAGCRTCAVVCRATAERLVKAYKIPLPHVVHNVPLRKEWQRPTDDTALLRAELGIPSDALLVAYKGEIAAARGLVPFVRALPQAPGVHLVLAGSGHLQNELTQLSHALKIADSVHFLGRIPPSRFGQLLSQADLGHVLHEPIGENMPMTLPGKLFDCLHAGLPPLTAKGHEMEAIVSRFKAGFATDPKPAAIAALLRHLHAHPELRAEARTNCRQAAEAYCWEREEHSYLAYIKGAFSQ